MPDLGSSVFCSYTRIQIDEVQDLNEAKSLLLLKMKSDSDRNGGPRHITKLRAVGDSDQAINGYVGSFRAGIRGFHSRALAFGISKIHVTSLTYSLRCPPTIVRHANACLEGAFNNYASVADPCRDPAKPWMQALPQGQDGCVMHEATFFTHPVKGVLETSPSAKVGVIGRRHLELSKAYELMVAHGQPCQMSSHMAPTDKIK